MNNQRIDRERLLSKCPDRLVRFSLLCGRENLIPCVDFKALPLSGVIRELKHSPDLFVRQITQKACKCVEETFKSYNPSGDLVRRILGISIICDSVDENFIGFFKRLNDNNSQKKQYRCRIDVLTESVRQIYHSCDWTFENLRAEDFFCMNGYELGKFDNKKRVMREYYHQLLFAGTPMPALNNFRQSYFRQFGERLE
ncbi:hypothetical protein FACS18942_10200 [Planctomycetales bacterium]|nr:hypothetical protein FACS18942_10200 [Planctomycetales bacterium]